MLKSYSRMVFSILLLLFVVGCSTQPERIIETKVVTKVVTIPETLLEPRKPSAPPSVADYLAASVEERETLLRKYAQGLLGDISKLNNRLSEIKTLQEKTKEELLKGASQ